MKIGRKKSVQVMWMIKALLACYIVTGTLLVLVSFMMYRFQLEEKIVTAAIVTVYGFSTLAGGFIAGKIKSERKILWGFLVGSIYFLLLILISYGVYRQLSSQEMNLITTYLLCIGGGMMGGLLS